MRFTTFILGLLISISSYATETSTTFTLTSSSFPDAGPIPTLYTCDRKDISPGLSWTNIPAKTQSFALIVSDPDAPNGVWYHWVVYNIPSSVKELPEGFTRLPAGAVIGKNSWDKAQYNGPCPPKSSLHKYIFTLYALNSKLQLPANTDAKTILAAAEKHMIQKAQITAVYSRF
jgi:Raf kinase inhibitor-like YbhB/YbcL family protein